MFKRETIWSYITYLINIVKNKIILNYCYQLNFFNNFKIIQFNNYNYSNLIIILKIKYNLNYYI